MTTWHWVGIGVTLVTLFFGQILLAGLSAFILWTKTKGLLEYKLTSQGQRIGEVERSIGGLITVDRCDSCKNEAEKRGKILMKENYDAHNNLNAKVDKLDARTEHIGKGVTELSALIQNGFRNKNG